MFHNINKYLDITNYYDIKQNIDNQINFYLFIETIIEEFDTLNDIKIEFIVKIILNSIIYFEGNVDNICFLQFYNLLKKKKDNNFELLDNFILLYDKYRNIKIHFFTLNFHLIKIFNNKFNNLNEFKYKNLLTKNDIENIKNIIETEIMAYYNSFFDINYNKLFFRRISDVNNIISQNIHTNEMIERLLQLVKVYTLKILENLNIKIITINDFLSLDYIDRVNYFKIFYVKTNNLFKLYFNFYEQYHNIKHELSELIKLDPLNYIETLNDSTSSYILSEDHLEIDMSKFDNTNIELLNLNNGVEELEDCELSSSDEYDDNADTPFIKLENKFESTGDSNSSSEKFGFDNISDEDNEENEINNEENEINNEENEINNEENEINDIFIKNIIL